MATTLECTQSPREHPWTMRVGQKVNKGRFKGLWTEKVKRVKYRALRFSLQCNGYQDVNCNFFKTDVPCVRSALGVLQE